MKILLKIIILEATTIVVAVAGKSNS